jgi:hypothetical protein
MSLYPTAFWQTTPRCQSRPPLGGHQGRQLGEAGGDLLLAKLGAFGPQSPGCNWVIERPRGRSRTRLYLHRFQTSCGGPTVIGAFIAGYKHGWLIVRLGYRIPTQVSGRGVEGRAVSIWPIRHAYALLDTPRRTPRHC